MGVDRRARGMVGTHSVSAVGDVMNDHIKQRNLECFLAWQNKFRRGYVEPDPWPPVLRYLYDRDLGRKRKEAAAWMSSCPWRRRKVRVRTFDALLDNPVRGIWTARSALKRSKQ